MFVQDCIIEPSDGISNDTASCKYHQPGKSRYVQPNRMMQEASRTAYHPALKWMLFQADDVDLAPRRSSYMSAGGPSEWWLQKRQQPKFYCVHQALTTRNGSCVQGCATCLTTSYHTMSLPLHRDYCVQVPPLTSSSNQTLLFTILPAMEPVLPIPLQLDPSSTTHITSSNRPA